MRSHNPYSVGIVLSWCQELIAKQGAGSFEDKLKNADRETANLFSSINILQEQLYLADIIANPDAITYGQKHYSQLYGFIYKMVKLFEPRAAKRGISISLRGSSVSEVLTYNSFQFVPLILLDNAVKYSYRNKEIVISINENDKKVILTVNSFGNLVPIESREKIFDKYERGTNGTTENPHGMGLGLYLASLIAKAHGTEICYECSPDNGEVGSNEFSIVMDIV